jgi:hypothetical protein
MNPPVPRGGPPLSDVHRLKDLHSHVAAGLVLLAKGGRVHGHSRRAAEAVSRHAVRLLRSLSCLLARITDAQADHDVSPAATSRPE